MIEYQLNTGIGSTGSLFYQRGQIFNGIGSIFNNNPLDNAITVNGQTLLETLASIQVVGQQEIIDNSGQFFLTGGFLKNETGFLPIPQNSNLKYDSRISGERIFFESSIHSHLITGFSGQAGSLQGESVFLNGVKLTSGLNYIEDSNGNFSWTDPNNSVTGVLFSSPFRNWPIYTGVYDLLNTRFNEGNSIGYLNGVKIDETSILETSSLLTGIIETGVEPFVEFNLKPPSQTLFF